MRADPYIFFDGRCAEAFEFYRDSLGAEIKALVHFRDMPGASSSSGDRVMHAALSIGETTILGSDGRTEGTSKPCGFSISLQVDDVTEAERLFAALSKGGQIEVPLMTAPFAARFGKVADRFGTPWLIVSQQSPTV